MSRETPLMRRFYATPHHERIDLLEHHGVPHQLAVEAVMADWSNASGSALSRAWAAAGPLDPDYVHPTEPTIQITEDSMPEPTEQIDLAIYGGTISAPVLATELGVSSARITQLIQAERLNAEREVPGQQNTSWMVAIDEKLLVELDKRGIAYTLEHEPYTEPAGADTDEEDPGSKEAPVALVELPEWTEKSGDGQEEDEPLPPASPRHPVEIIAEELAAGPPEPPVLHSTPGERAAYWSLELDRRATIARRTMGAVHEAVVELESAQYEIRRAMTAHLSALGVTSVSELAASVAADEEEG